MKTPLDHHARWQTLLEGVTWFGAAAWGRTPPVARLRDGAGAGAYLHSEWGALLNRFVHDGGVDYGTLTRVQRLFEAYLERLANTDPDTFADADDQLAFYINAYNALALYQVVQHYPVPSIRSIPYAFVRPFPVGKRNLSLAHLHAAIIRSFGDPRAHAALSPAARGTLLPELYLGTTLQQQLDVAMRRLLADPVRGARYDAASNTLEINAAIYGWGGDVAEPQRMPGVYGLIGGYLEPQRLLDALEPYLPPALADVARTRRPALRPLPFDWSLNEQLYAGRDAG